MSLSNLFIPNKDDLFCNELTCNVLNCSSLNVSGGISLSGNQNIVGNLTVSGNITATGYVQANVLYNQIGTVFGAVSNTTIGQYNLPNSVYYLTGNNLGNIAFTMPTYSQIVTNNPGSGVTSNSFTFTLGNWATGTSYLSLSGNSTVIISPPIYLPASSSGSVTRTCIVVNNGNSTFQVY